MADGLLAELIVGIIAGTMSSVFGLGGGVVIVPALSIYLGFSQHEAVATSLFAIALITLINALRFQIQSPYKWRNTLLLSALGALTAFIAGHLAVFFQEQALSLLFVLVLCFLIWRLIKKQSTKNIEDHDSTGPIKLPAMGAFAGFISGFCGVGGGSVLGPLLINCKQINEADAVPITNVFMTVSAFAASVAYASAIPEQTHSWMLGQIHLDSAFFIFLAAMPAALIGTKFHRKISPEQRRLFLIAFLAFILIRVLIHIY